MRDHRSDDAEQKNSEDELVALFTQWLVLSPMIPWAELPHLCDLPPIPQELVQTVTLEQPNRDTVLNDARLWCAFPKPRNFGLEVELVACLAPSRPRKFWTRSGSESILGPITFEVSWYDSMDPQGIDRQSSEMVWQSVRLEQGQWRLFELYDAKARAASRRDYADISSSLKFDA